MQRIDIGKSPSRETHNQRQHGEVGLWESTGSNRETSLYFAQKHFGDMAILCADDQSVIPRMRTSFSGAAATVFSISWLVECRMPRTESIASVVLPVVLLVGRVHRDVWPKQEC